MMRGRLPFGVAFIIFCLLLAVGCGKKTSPEPPPSFLPPAVRDLSVELSSEGARLQWTKPARSVSGEVLPGNLTFVVQRAVVGPEDYCEGCPLAYRQVHETASPGAPVQQDEMRFFDADLTPGYFYSYRVQPRTPFFSAGEASNTVSFWWQRPAAAPTNLAIEERDRELRLSWSPPEQVVGAPQHEPPYEYEVLRSADGDNFSIIKVVSKTTCIDQDVRNRTRYYYKVRLRTRYQSSFLPGHPSAVVEACPRDLAPPSAPLHLRVVQSNGVARLIWDLVQEADLKGYRIYRRLPGEAKRRLIGNAAATVLYFDDTDFPAGDRWYYSVTSIDGETPPNESDAAVEVLFEPSR